MITLTQTAPNLTAVTHTHGTDKCVLHFSYETLIAVETPAEVLVYTQEKFSRTTAKHLKRVREAHQKGQSGTFSRAHLNACAASSLRLVYGG